MVLQNFSWLVKNKIAGAALSDSVESLSELWNLGIRALVCLVEWPVDQNLMRRMGFEYLFLKIPSFMPPTQQQIDKFIQFTKEMEKKNKPVVVCCRMGWGRTGSMLASYLVSKGFDAERAIEEVRRKRPRSIESVEQEEAIREYASRLGTASTT
jgi:atypical dual specificity phosphatase